MQHSYIEKYNSILSTKVNFPIIGITVMYLLAFIDFSGYGGGLLNLILAAVMCAVFFTDKYYTVVALILLTNDYLGNIVSSYFSFYWLLTLLVLARLLLKQKVNLKYFLYFFAALILCIRLPYVGTDTRNVLSTLSFVISILYVFSFSGEHSKERQGFFFSVAVTITLISLRSILVGGNMFYHDYTSRLGIIGVGVGDPNFSCLILLTGVAILLAQNHLNAFVRFGMIILILISMVQTVSITGLLGLLILIIAYILVRNKPSITVRYLLIGIIICIIFVNICLTFLQSDQYINFYIQRITQKLNAFQNNNFDVVTTNRSLLFRKYSQYFFSQDYLTLLFGTSFRDLWIKEVSHNTYLDLLLRFGFVGFGFIGFFIIRKFIKEIIRYYKTKTDGEVFLLKILYLFFSAGLSIFYGSSFALWFAVLILL